MLSIITAYIVVPTPCQLVDAMATSRPTTLRKRIFRATPKFTRHAPHISFLAIYGVTLVTKAYLASHQLMFRALRSSGRVYDYQWYTDQPF
jgi:hypothetical protein